MAELMNRIDFFRVLSVNDKQALIDNKLVQLRSYIAGEQLIEHGDNGEEFFMLMTGKLNVLTPQGTQVAQLSPGSFFGEVAFILNEKRTASVVAESESLVMVINHTTLKLMPVKVKDKIKDKIISGLINRVAELNGKIENLTKV